MVMLNTIETDLINLKSIKSNIKKDMLIRNIAFNLLSYCKERELKQFSKEFLSSLFSSEIDKSFKSRATNKILKVLSEMGKIEKTKTTKSYIFIYRKPLLSMDYGSYNILMSKNGYRRSYFYFKGIKKVYILKNQSMNEPFKSWNCESEIKSYIAYKKQKCEVLNNMSFKKQKVLKNIIAYNIL